jgi:hypothetical protein
MKDGEVKPVYPNALLSSSRRPSANILSAFCDWNRMGENLMATAKGKKNIPMYQLG